MQRQSGRETVEGEALRYLAELPWVPFAMTLNDELEWRPRGARSVEVSVQLLEKRLVVGFDFDEVGDIVRASSEMRLLRLDRRWISRPWAGTFGRYEVLEGIRMPTEAEVSWSLEDGPFVYWRGRVTSAELLDEPFEPV